MVYSGQWLCSVEKCKYLIVIMINISLHSAHRRYTNKVWLKSEVVDYNYIININAIAVLPRQYKTFTVQWCWENEETSPSRPQRSVGPVIVKVCRIQGRKENILLYNNPGVMYTHTDRRKTRYVVMIYCTFCKDFLHFNDR